MIGQVFKIHSDFYYVHTNKGVFECKAREILKKQHLQIFVGDYVKLENEHTNSKQAFISSIEPRQNFIPRPKTANLDQIIIVSAIKEPALDFTQLNRYISLCELYKIKPVLCFNKNDLSNDDSIIENVFSIYEPLGYEIIFTCATERIGIEDLLELLENKTSALCGASGVGKSTLINAVAPDLNIKTASVSDKTLRGTHTTRHLEIFEIKKGNMNSFKIVDTPGFSHLRFDFIMPEEVDCLFKEISPLKKNCKYKDCLHLTEDGCSVLNSSAKIAPSRYESYTQFVSEAAEYKKSCSTQSLKDEGKTKQNQNKTITKISSKKRAPSRKTQNQNKGTTND